MALLFCIPCPLPNHPICVTLLLSIIWLLLGSTAATGSSSRRGHETDQLALFAIKAKITRDPFQATSLWNRSVNHCRWYGVVCGRRHQRVIALHLNSLQLAGYLSPHIGNMSFLRIISIHNNSFGGQIPQEIGRLSRLQIMHLENNSFTGEIPGNISNCLRLMHLGLGGNGLVGKLPSHFGISLLKLQGITLYSNNLTGKIPSSFGNFSMLKILNAKYNSFEGSIPNSFGHLKSLIHLQLGINNLSGIIPPSIYNLSSIVTFSLPVNRIRGGLPRNLGLTLPNLQVFNIHTNQFSGILPASLSNASNLLALFVARNKFTGDMPSLAGSPSLHELAVHVNHLGNGDDNDLNFLYSIANCSNLEYLSLSDNNFYGMLPKSIGNFSMNLRTIGLGRNQLFGSLPSEIGNLLILETLGLETNLLTGSIPPAISGLGNLRDLYLNSNNFSGEIPSSLGNLTLLDTLVLDSNSLQGSIPSSLGNCQQLSTLLLSENNLGGAIPKEVMNLSSLSIILALSQNHLIGSLPLEVGSLSNLGYLDISENHLSGEIPSSLSSCIKLEGLYLQGNFIQGNIPTSLVSLKVIEGMDFSRNNLSGEIPKFLERFAFLNTLNLSFNNFAGEVPVKGVFKNASAISITGNRILCGGIPELHLPRCPTKQLSKRGMSTKIKLVIACASGIFALILIILFLLSLSNFLRKKKGLPSSSSSFDVSFLRLSYEELFKATEGFSSANSIGVGRFGSVYKGILDANSETVAVKVLKVHEKGALKSFMAECRALRNVRHRNLVKIITACASIDFQGNDFKAIVYDLMVNGSLEEWLHPVPRQDDGQAEEMRKLSLLSRLKIAIGIASALDYLHCGCHTPMVHCDIKPSNILLDGDMIAHVGDFGLARFIRQASQPSSSNQTSSIAIKGSIGYAAPEYGYGAEVSTFGDMYSFGIVLLEIFTGKRPTDDRFTNGLNLHNYAKMALPEQVMEILEPTLLNFIEELTITNDARAGNPVRICKVQECLISVVRIGVLCSSEAARERKQASDVLRELQLVMNILVGTGVH